MRAATDHPVRTAQLLAALVDARLACTDAPGAADAATELRDIADVAGIRLVTALADLATARLAAAAGQAGDAAHLARRALIAFSRLAMPYEAGHARLELAQALAGSAPALACDEARSALAVFEALGVPRATDAAAQLMHVLGGAAAPRPRVCGELTPREQEVLALVSLGASNADVAAALCISEKTAGHHVSHILAKLGVRNRTEAAAYAGKIARPAVAP
ncbi:MAG: Regulatory protein LuxR [Frankiales bacterium]|nr:Regulatory protein LuxR [Frankiales bacterium]